MQNDITRLNIRKDYRVPEVMKIIESLVTSRFYEFTKILVRGNTLVFSLTDTLLYYIPLKSEPKTIEDNLDFAANYKDLYDINSGKEEGFACHDYNVNGELRYILFNLKYDDILNGIYDGNIVAANSDLRSDEKFEELLNLKSDQGVKYYRMTTTDLSNTIFVPIFAGFPNINKQDNIGIKVYNINDNIIIELDIFKKKINRNMKILYRTIGL